MRIIEQESSEIIFCGRLSHERVAHTEYQIDVDHRWNFKINSYTILCDVAPLFQLALSRTRTPIAFPIWEALSANVIDEVCIAGDIQPSLMT